MDEKCEETLLALLRPNVVVIKQNVFLTPALMKIKEVRGRAEFCWTCTSHLIHFVLTEMNEEICTYVDADMYFYRDPQFEITKMLEAKKDVYIVPHWFTNKRIDLKIANQSGLYCVEFNTFTKSKESLNVLNSWMKQCDECCKFGGDGVYCGDQKYLEEWPKKYNCIYISNNRGMGMAPWNVWQFNMKKSKIYYKKKEIEPIFYHFQDIEFISSSSANINVFKKRGHHQQKLIAFFYYDYLKNIKKARETLLDYNISFGAFRNHGRDTTKKAFLKSLFSSISNRGIIGTIKYIFFSHKDIVNL